MIRGPWRILACVLLVAGPAGAGDLEYKERLLPRLVEHVPNILKTFDPDTGRFGSGIWLCNDQHLMYPLAVAYSYAAEGNPYYQDAQLLDAIMKAGDALIDDMDEQGKWVFRKKDGSTWGDIWMPWTYSRWARAFLLIRDDMPPDRREKWARALTLGYTGIRGNELGHVHNIPAHHAMGLYVAGKALNRPEWCKDASEFMMKVAAVQSEAGYWSEGVGPVVLYNYVYVDALGTYYAASGDRRVLPALKKAATFHRHFTYPGGENVETVDQRNPYKKSVSPGNVGFTFTSVGRAYLQAQWQHYGMDKLSADLTASLLLYGEEGAVEEVPAEESAAFFVLSEGGIDKAAVLRQGPWFICLSAYTAAVPQSRWIQDRQNFVSIYHEKAGLILGGGNTKLQPAWSNFTVGDIALLQHKAGDTSPNFLPRGELYHVPSAARLIREPTAGLDLTYGKETCRIRVRPKDDRTVEYCLEATGASGLPVVAHLTLLPRLKASLETGGGQKRVLEDSPLTLSPEQVGGSLLYAGCRLSLPESASLHWPAFPHNPYRKDGHATAEEGRIEIRIPFSRAGQTHRVTLEVLE